MSVLMEDLYIAVRKHSDLEDSEIIDAAKHGANSGYNGFIYYTDTIEFFDNNEDMIMEYAQEMARELGHKNWLEMVAGFNTEAYDMSTLKNVMSWFILEEVGRYIEDNPISIETLWDNDLIDDKFVELFAEIHIRGEVPNTNSKYKFLQMELKDWFKDKDIKELDNMDAGDFACIASDWLYDNNVDFDHALYHDELVDFYVEMFEEIWEVELMKRNNETIPDRLVHLK